MKAQRSFLIAAAAVGVASLGSSCTHYDPYGYAPATKRGAVAGGLIGAGVGTIVGSQSDRPLEGAAIGSAIGALGGAALGSARDDQYRYRSHHGTSYRYPPPPRYYGTSYRYLPPPRHSYHHPSHYHRGGDYYGGGSRCSPHRHGRY